MLTNEITESKGLVEGFINSRVVGHGLDQRTEKAYRLDLEHFHLWAEKEQARSFREGICMGAWADKVKAGQWEDWMESYLDYLKRERKLSSATICRKSRVMGYYLAYLAKQGVISGYRPLKAVKERGQKEEEPQPSRSFLSKKEADAFFEAMDREYGGLDSEFRRRICLRDMVMMELLFYHRIEISELLRIEVPDYRREKGDLLIRRKRGQDYQIQLFSQELQEKMGRWLEERIHFRREGEYWQRMFLSKLGRPLSMEMFIQIFDKYRKLAGIEKGFTPKDLKESSMKQYARELVVERCR